MINKFKLCIISTVEFVLCVCVCVRVCVFVCVCVYACVRFCVPAVCVYGLVYVCVLFHLITQILFTGAFETSCLLAECFISPRIESSFIWRM